jgi:hypothetical protein
LATSFSAQPDISARRGSPRTCIESFQDMAIFRRIKNFFHSGSGAQVLGYSPAEMRLLFQKRSIADHARFINPYPKKSSLAAAGIHAVYAALLIDKSDLANFMALVDYHFLPELNRQFQGALVMQSKSMKGDERLCFLIADEFGGHTIKFMTDSLDFLNNMDQCWFAVPPPWAAFKGYNPEWWGGPMQGAQGYYEDNYFSPFFRILNAEQKKGYCEKFGAGPDWAKALELYYDADEGKVPGQPFDYRCLSDTGSKP